MTRVISRRRTEHLFFSGVALMLIGYVVLGFWRSYLAAGLMMAPLPSLLVHIHAILFVGWIALFMAQNVLIRAGNVATHRRLGAIMGWWAAAIVLIGPATVVMAVRRPASGVGTSAFAGDLAQTIVFAILIGSGLVHRRNGPVHKRLMTLATAAIMGPAIIRWPFDFIQNEPPIGILFFYLLPPLLLVAYDLATRRRVQKVTWLGLGLMAGVLAVFLLLPAWSGWLAFTHWVQRV